MPRFRKLPVEVEARRFVVSDLAAVERLAEWCGGLVRGTALPLNEVEIEIPTKEGDMRASWGDWIIKGVAGEFYPCKPEIFLQTYEQV